MKIAYIAELILDKQKGVLQKILQQIICWRNLGHDVKIFLRSYVNEDEKLPEFYNIYSAIPNSKHSKPNLIRGFLNKCLTHREIVQDIKKYSPDIIYYRYKIWYPFLVRDLLSLASYVVELNTDDINEGKLRGPFRYYYNKSTRKMLLKNAAGFFCVTEEIARKNSNFHKPTYVIGNGYDLSSVKPLLAPCNKRPQVLFVGGGYEPWYGVDKIITLAKHIREFDFHIVGFPRSEFPLCEALANNIYFHGYLEKDRKVNLYKIADIAIGTLALHRIQMNEASPLKVREYLAYGIPTIIGYKDTDLKNENPAILRLPNKETNVLENIDKIRQFVYHQIGKRVDPASIYILSYKEKEKKRMHFLEEVASKTS